ncbi:protein PSK SIMULATOR 2 isoform X3 [Manihot esculenta]|uniref:protein PSK SIMULATOR 2 isoform X3 n=1 Tax=Manihot esculenta TaxID=3983 RepID=UPI001CC66AFB|nr:protein PSK SIMULATOR 2 isoform X3 [Manihot esculenta]
MIILARLLHRRGIIPDGQKSSFIGKAGAVSLEKAVKVLDTLGSSMSNLNARSTFVSGMASRGNKISILAFEVANTVAKGANLFESLSEENVQFLKKEILHSEGVQELVSTDLKELLILAAADKREEFDVFAREVIRFGDLCKDPQWHSLDRYFTKLDSEHSGDGQTRADAKTTMQELTTLVQHTSELYHELHALDRFEQDYQQKLEEVESLHLPKKGESLTILQGELKQQRKLVRSLKKKSLWSKNLEEIMEKLVDIVTYLNQAILEAFGNNGVRSANEESDKNLQRLGAAGLALHYANVINQIDNIASRPTSLPPNTRDNLYHRLPSSVKIALRSRLQTVDTKEELTVAQVKAKMEKTLHWLVPIATNTNKAHQGFGWVGEWANAGHEFDKKSSTQNNLIRLQTLHHADKQKTDTYILELVTWLHRLISLVRHRVDGFKAMPVRSRTQKGLFLHTKMHRTLSLNNGITIYSSQISQEDTDLLDKVCRRRLVPGISKSQEFSIASKTGKFGGSSKSTGSSPVREINTRQKLHYPNNLDAVDGSHSTS